MIKFIIGFERCDGLSRRACQEYLAGSHGPLVASVPEFRRHVRAYVQNFAIGDEASAAPSFDPDGAAELWFDDMAVLTAAFSEPRYLELIRPDEQRFAHPARLVAAFTRERTVFATACAKNVKLMRFLAPVAGIDAATFESLWACHYAGGLATDAAIGALVTRYVQNWSVPVADTPFPLARPVAGVDEFWFQNEADLHRFIDLERSLLARPSLNGIVDRPACIAFAATERVVLQ